LGSEENGTQAMLQMPREPVTVERLVGAMNDLAPLIREHRDAFDRDCRLSQLVFEALARIGLFKLWLPKMAGGYELHPLDFMEVVEAASALDGSIGWLVGNGGGISRTGGYVALDIARGWYRDPRAFMVSSGAAAGIATPTEGGYHISGRWPFGSGIHHATQLVVMCNVAVVDGNQPRSPIMCHLEAAHARIFDTWQVSGLRGTGSCDFEITKAFVPDSHTYEFLSQPSTQPGALYRVPNVSAFVWTVATVPLGIARGALSNFTLVAQRKGRAATSVPLAEREVVQDTIGRLDAALRAARALIAESMVDVFAATDIGGERMVKARAMFRSATAHAADTSIGIVTDIARIYGAGSVFESDPIARALRDVNAATQHLAMTPVYYALAGRILLGMEPGTARF
jgi:indole-3-acetate monooxygenase